MTRFVAKLLTDRAEAAIAAAQASPRTDSGPESKPAQTPGGAK